MASGGPVWTASAVEKRRDDGVHAFVELCMGQLFRWLVRMRVRVRVHHISHTTTAASH